MRVLVFTLLFLFCFVIPGGLCFLKERHPNWFRHGKLLLWIAALTVFSWSSVVGAILIPCFCGLFIPRGPELIFALFFGWAYLWIASVPMFVIYGSLRLVRRLCSCIGQR